MATEYIPHLLSFDRNAEELLDLQDEIIRVNRADLDTLGATFPWTQKDLRKFGDVEMKFATQASSCTFPMYVATDPELREVAAAAEITLDAYSVEVSQREDIYSAVKDLKERSDKGEVSLTKSECRWVEKLLRDFQRSGLELAPEKKERLGWVKRRISELCTEFSKNLNENVTKEAFSREELDGMAESWLSSLEKADDTDKVHAGKLYVTLKYPDVVPLMQHCRVPETRKRMDFLKGAMCEEENVPLFDEVLELRKEMASLLGFETFADYALEIRMAKKKETVLDFLGVLSKKLMPYAKKEVANLLQLKEKECKELGLEFDGVINSWDMLYYHTMLVDKEYQLDEEKLQEYFPLEVVTAGMHEIYQKLLGLRFEKVENPKGKWHEDVVLYAVYDRDSGNFVGQFFLDMFPRDGKYGHAMVCGLQRAGNTCEGERQLPCCAMLCNFPKPTQDRPSLLKHRDVETYFHEFGHVMHNMCTETEIHSFSCTRVERDFVEAPSQMLENWCYEKEPLEMMSRHFEIGKTLPDELLQAIIRSKNVNTGLLNLRQIFFSTFDMTCHTSAEKVDTEKLWRELRSSISLIPQQDGCNPTAGFAHLMGGYESGYYGYLWSEVYSADLFVAFGGKLMDPETGLRYRKTILAPGGSKDGMQMVEEFLGRKPNQDAFLAHIGINM